MSSRRPRFARNLFLLLFVGFTIACVVLNGKMRDGFREEECETVQVQVESVKSIIRLRKYDFELISVTVSYEGEEQKLRGAVDYDKFERLAGKNYDAILYEGRLYYSVGNARTSSPTGRAYFTCMAAAAVSLFAGLALSGKSKQQNQPA